nr:vitamin D 25-hydroxylase-like [Lytechinus pictus]
MIADLAHGVFDFGFSSILFGITTSLLVVWLMKWVSKRRKINWPPGPMTVPWPLHLIGDLVMLAQGTNPVVMLCELNKSVVQSYDYLYINSTINYHDSPLSISNQIVAEINSVVGSSATPRYEDRKLMPYTEATLMEVLRYRPIAPGGVPHRATSDLKVKGYDILAGDNLMMNILYIHHIPEIWGDPEVFRPERFLSEDGKAVVKHDAYMPFGAGRRVCLGEQLAKMEMFLFFTNVLQRFRITLPPGVKPNYDYGHRVTTLLPKAYEVILEER